jgi:hypothetical protein
VSSSASAGAAAIAFAPHSGWPAVVALSGDVDAPEVVLRERIELADRALPGAVQPYHAAEGLAPAEAARLIERCRASAAALAYEALRAAVESLRGRGDSARAVGILASSGRQGPTLEATLASHALIHTADGNHFREALAQAAVRCGLRVESVPSKTVLGHAARALGRPEAAVQAQVESLKRQVGPPWGADQKAAALLAWALLAEACCAPGGGE